MVQHHYKWRPGTEGKPTDHLGFIDALDEGSILGPRGLEETETASRRFTSLLADLAKAWDVPLHSDGALPQAVRTPLRGKVQELAGCKPILLDREWSYARVIRLPDGLATERSGYAALHGDPSGCFRISGLLLDGTFAVSKTERNLGFGSALIAAQLLEEGWLSIWDREDPGATTGGIAAMRRGMRLAKEISAPFQDWDPGNSDLTP